MIKRASLAINLIIFTAIVPLIAMEYKGPKPTITKEIALTVQAASQEGEIRKKIIDRFTKNGVDISKEKDRPQTKLIQLGAIFLGARSESNTLKIMRLLKYENNSYYRPFFKKYPGLSDALVELAEIRDFEAKKKGKKE